MATFLTDLRSKMRRDLHDEDSASYRWSDDVLNRHLERAVADISAAAGRTATATLAAEDGVRSYDLSAIADLCDRPQAMQLVEWPSDETPRSSTPFRVWANRLYLLADEAPVAGDSIRIWYTRPHVLSEESTTLSPDEQELALLGAEAYAALELEAYSAGRLTVTGRAGQDYRAWGQHLLGRFRQGLDERRRQAALAVDGRTRLGHRT